MLYDLDYYEQFFDEFLSLRYSSNWTYLGYAPPALLCVFLLFLKKDTQKRLAGLRAAFVLLTLMLLLPAAGSAMNGFSYTANRWGFGYSFLVCLILVLLWPELFRLSHREKAGLLGLSFLYLALLIFLGGAGSPEAFAGLALLLLSLAAASSGPGLCQAEAAAAETSPDRCDFLSGLWHLHKCSLLQPDLCGFLYQPFCGPGTGQ